MSVTALEPWLDKKGLSKQICFSVRWIEKMMPKGLPHFRIKEPGSKDAGRVRFHASKVEQWLRDNGYVEESV